MGGRVESVGEILGRLLENPTWGRRVSEGRALGLWKGVVGESLGKHTHPLRVKDGRIVIAVEDPIWKQEVGLLSREIIRKLNEGMGREVIRDIVLVVR